MQADHRIEELRIGYFAVDEQHKEILDTINHLCQAVEENKPREDVIVVLNSLEGYLNTHFEMEESIMVRRGYPKHEDHKTEHEYFRKEFEKLKISLLEYTSTVKWSGTEKMKNLLIDWNINHIKTSDRDFGNFIRLVVEKGPPFIS